MWRQGHREREICRDKDRKRDVHGKKRERERERMYTERGGKICVREKERERKEYIGRKREREKKGSNKGEE